MALVVEEQSLKNTTL